MIDVRFIINYVLFVKEVFGIVIGCLLELVNIIVEDIIDYS